MSYADQAAQRTEHMYRFQTRGGAAASQRSRFYIADVPGLGKTRQGAYAAFLTRDPGLPDVVICPASAVARWQEDWQLTGPQRPPLIFTYDKVSRGAELPEHIGTLLIDEAHRLKSKDAKRTKIILLDVVRRAARVYLMSGTPWPNHQGEMYTVLKALWPERLRQLGILTERHYLDFFCYWRETQYGIQVLGNKHVPEFQDLLYGTGPQFSEPIMIRRAFECAEVLEEMKAMPQILWRNETIDAGDLGKQLAGYEIAALEVLRAIEEGREPQTEHLSVLLRLIGDLKAPKVAEVLFEELADQPGKKVVVMAYHHSVLDILEKKLGYHGVVRVDGSSSEHWRKEAVDLFQQNANTRVFLGQIVACKESLTLTAAAQVELVESLWSPEDNVQAACRIRRHGQTAEKLVARMWGLANSFDAVKARVQSRKARLTQEMIG